MRWRSAVVDAIVALVAFAISAWVLAASEPVAAGIRDPDALAYVLLAVYSATVIVRRRVPVTAVFVALLAGLAFAAANYPAALTPIVLLPIYTAAALLPPRRARQLLGAVLLLSLIGSTLGPGPTNIGTPALVVSAWLLGNYVGSRRRYTDELEHQNRELEQARLELADQAVTEERLRIARELHDVVAHTLGVVAIHAGTGRMVAIEDPVAARDALSTIETATRSALVEMRQLLGVLRGSDGTRQGAREPAPGLEGLDALVAEVVKSGVAVHVRVEGDRPDVPAGIDVSAYRIVQEALTNVIKHAGRANTTVAIRYSCDAVAIEVDNERPLSPTPLPALSDPPSGGHGLIGMRERVAMYDGQLDAGPRADGGFRVAARLPLGERPLGEPT